ncbi:hypothetical protein CEE45_16460 [Candidatus Heimdallarchaeota archaeon B3_Heim]|nr:MAG: hypothetical protein CEE45_16460 [Candidatus Heimdallarchaeota archaeon B3_Heim]
MSPRPKRNRRIGNPPFFKGFRPTGVPFPAEEVISIQFEEYEALKLTDYDNLSHVEAAKKMQISRPTFTRIYDTVRKKLAKAFVEGKPVVIEGGQVTFDKQWLRCNDCHYVFHLNFESRKVCPHCQSDNIENINESIRNWRPGMRHRRGQKKNWHREFRICLNCWYKISHMPGNPCHNLKCPKCDITLIRE